MNPLLVHLQIDNVAPSDGDTVVYDASSGTWGPGAGAAGIPELDTDPVSPDPETAWVLRTGSPSGGGSPVFPFPLLFTTPGVGSYTYQLSYRTLAGTTIRVSMS